MSGCINCTEYFTVGIWYDKRTGKVIDSEILDKWDECKEPDYPANGNAPGTTILPKLPPSDKIGIKNKVEHPCISNTLESIDNALKILINNELTSHNINLPMNFIFEDVTTLPDNINGRYLNMKPNPGGGMDFFIILNQKTLPENANESAATTMIHEVIHGLLEYQKNDWNVIQHHNEMANTYHSQISKALISIYGSDFEAYASALAWGGLQTTSAWDALTIEQKTDIVRILKSFEKNGKEGTRCY
jgi:hypothetical protein